MTLFVCSEVCFESIPLFTATIRHELSRALSDKLNLKEDEAWLQKKIQECILQETLLHGSSAEVSTNETILCPFLGNTFLSSSHHSSDLNVSSHEEEQNQQQSQQNSKQNSSSSSAKYLDPSSLNVMRTKLVQALQLFNATRPRKKTTPQSMEMDLVLFDDREYEAEIIGFDEKVNGSNVHKIPIHRQISLTILVFKNAK